MDPDWKVEKPIGFHRFREKLGIQKLTYSPVNGNYPGDEKLREHTRTPKKKRPRDLSPAPSSSISSTSTVSTRLFADAWKTGRLCGFLGPLNEHIASLLPKNSSNLVCAVCGKRAYQYCSLCDRALHYHTPVEGMAVPCFFLYHDAGFCGLARSDCKGLGTPKGAWTMADGSSIKSNSKSMKLIHKSLFSVNNSASTVDNSSDSNSNSNSIGAEQLNDRCI